MSEVQRAKIVLKILNQIYPTTKTPLDHKNIFTLLISVLLSAQCTDVNVNNVTKNIYPFYNKPEDFVRLGQKKIEKLINKIGLFRNKAKNIYQLSKILIREHNSKVPNDFDKLLALPGVGRKTANVVLNEGFGQSTIAVDTHIFRVSNRTKLAPGKNPDEVEKNLYKVVPPKYLKDAHHLLLLHGRYTCKARTPLCKKCVIEPHCKFNKKKFD